jgi:hypothetical protein
MTNKKLLLAFLGIALAGMLTMGCPGNDSNSSPAGDSNSNQNNTSESIAQQTRVVLVEVFTRDG